MSDATPAPTPVVVDASVGLKWYVTEVHSGEAARLLGEEFEPHVPSHFYVELASALWKKVMLRGELTEDQARDVRGAVDEVPVVSHPTAGLLDEAFEIALVTRRTVYDCLYIALRAAGLRGSDRRPEALQRDTGRPVRPPGSLGR